MTPLYSEEEKKVPGLKQDKTKKNNKKQNLFEEFCAGIWIGKVK